MEDFRANVLLVDDDEDAYVLTRDMLADIDQQRFKLDWIESYDKGLEALARNEHDVCLLDYSLGAGTGVELLVEAIRCGCKVPVVVLTGMGSYEIDVRVMKAGAMDYLVKDRIDAQTLERSLRYAIERRRAEELLLVAQQRLWQAEQLESLGSLAGGVAHEFNNLLQAIGGYTHLALEQIPTDVPAHHDLETVIRVIDRAATLARQLLGFSRRHAWAPQLVRLNDVVMDAVRLLRPLLGARIELATELDERTGTVRADPGLIQQTLINLCVNARDAIPGRGRLTLTTRRTVIDNQSAETVSGVSPGAYAVITCCDNGCGMTPEVQQRIFEPFYTTKEHGKGTGLGLPMAFGIVQQHGGTILVESRPGEGSEFKIYLPSVQQQPAARDVPPPAPSQTGTILVADDEQVVLDMTTRLLEDTGYTVVRAKDGEEALGAFREHSGEISLALLDASMPKMDGPEAYRQMAEVNPQLPLVLVSGRELPEGVQQQLGERSRCLLKPFTPDELLRTIGELVGAG